MIAVIKSVGADIVSFRLSLLIADQLFCLASEYSGPFVW